MSIKDARVVILQHKEANYPIEKIHKFLDEATFWCDKVTVLIKNGNDLETETIIKWSEKNWHNREFYRYAYSSKELMFLNDVYNKEIIKNGFDMLVIIGGERNSDEVEPLVQNAVENCIPIWRLR